MHAGKAVAPVVGSVRGPITTGIFPLRKNQNKKNAQQVQVENDKFDFTVDEGNDQLNSSREKNYGKHRRRKVD